MSTRRRNLSKVVLFFPFLLFFSSFLLGGTSTHWKKEEGKEERQKTLWPGLLHQDTHHSISGRERRVLRVMSRSVLTEIAFRDGARDRRRAAGGRLRTPRGSGPPVAAQTAAG